MTVVINIFIGEQIQKCFYFICEITGLLVLAVMGVQGFETKQKKRKENREVCFLVVSVILQSFFELFAQLDIFSKSDLNCP